MDEQESTPLQDPRRLTQSSEQAVIKGQAAYNPLTLRGYDFFVYGLPTPWIWRVPTRTILDFYQHHISESHLDVGVGTGLFLDRVRFPTATPRIALLDLNPHSLRATARRITRYAPSLHQANVLEAGSIARSGLEGGFGSIGMNYLLHCLPGAFPHKGIVFANLKPYLRPGGILFGTTLLYDLGQQALASRWLMRSYNHWQVFDNRGDTQASLTQALTEQFAHWELRMVGALGLFWGRV